MECYHIVQVLLFFCVYEHACEGFVKACFFFLHIYLLIISFLRKCSYMQIVVRTVLVTHEKIKYSLSYFYKMQLTNS